MDMTAIIIVAIVFGCGSILLALLIISNLIGKALGNRGGRLSDEESQIMQELFYGLKKMEDRVEALETLLLEKGRGE